MRVRAVVFDIGGILELGKDGAEPTSAFPLFLLDREARLGLQPGELMPFFTSNLAGGQIGAYTYAEFRQRLGVHGRFTEAQLDEFLEAFWDFYLGTWNGELADYFRSLRGRYRTALLSNSFVGAREREHARYGMGDLAELIVYSHEVGCAKPDRAIYELTCKLLGVNPEETVFLDDVPAYIEGAREIGMKTVLYENNAQAIAAIEALL